MVTKLRLERINDRIREELSEMLVMEVHDPRLAGITITTVRVDRELAYADIFVSAIEGSSTRTRNFRRSGSRTGLFTP